MDDIYVNPIAAHIFHVNSFFYLLFLCTVSSFRYIPSQKKKMKITTLSRDLPFLFFSHTFLIKRFWTNVTLLRIHFSQKNIDYIDYTVVP